jgi:hypothetical protein
VGEITEVWRQTKAIIFIQNTGSLLLQVVSKDMDENKHETIQLYTCLFNLICIYVKSWTVSHVHLHPYPFLLQDAPLT